MAWHGRAIGLIINKYFRLALKCNIYSINNFFLNWGTVLLMPSEAYFKGFIRVNGHKTHEIQESRAFKK